MVSLRSVIYVYSLMLLMKAGETGYQCRLHLASETVAMTTASRDSESRVTCHSRNVSNVISPC